MVVHEAWPTKSFELLLFLKETQDSPKALSQYIAFSALMHQGETLDMSEFEVTYFGQVWGKRLNSNVASME